MAFIITPGQLNQRADFYFQLQSLVRAGVPIIQALQMLAGNNSVRSYRPHLEGVMERLQNGATLGEAMAAQPNWLPEFDLSLITAGEQSGRLEEVLRNLGNYYKDRASLARSLISSLAYPIFIIHLAILVFPPGYLRLLVWEGEVALFLTQKLSILLPLYLLAFLAVMAGQGTRGSGWRALMERVLNTVPILGKARRELAMARLSASLEGLLSAGVPTVHAWELAARASGSSAIKTAIGRMLPRVQAGATPAEAIQPFNVFPEVFKNLYSSGELSGQLDTSLVRLRDYFQEQATLKLQNFAQWLPRIIFMAIAIGIGYVIFKFWSNYYGQMFNAI